MSARRESGERYSLLSQLETVIETASSLLGELRQGFVKIVWQSCFAVFSVQIQVCGHFSKLRHFVRKVYVDGEISV